MRLRAIIQRRRARRLVDRADGVRFGQRVVDDGLEEFVGPLEHDARAVAGVLFGAGRPAVFEVAEQVDSVGDDVVGRTAVEVDDGADAAVRSFVGRIRKPDRAGMRV